MSFQLTYTPAEVQTMGIRALRIAIATRKGWQWFTDTHYPRRPQGPSYTALNDSRLISVFTADDVWTTCDPPLHAPDANIIWGFSNWPESIVEADALIAELIAADRRPNMGYRQDCILASGELCFGWWVRVSGAISWEMFGETLPLAICRAYLLATNPPTKSEQLENTDGTADRDIENARGL